MSWWKLLLTVPAVAIHQRHCAPSLQRADFHPLHAAGAAVPACGTYEGIPHDASINGQCTLPDGEARGRSHRPTPELC